MCKQHRLKSNQSIHVLLPLEVLAFLVIHPRQGQVPPVLQDRTAKIPLLSGSKWWHPDPDGDKSRELPGNLTGSPSERSRAMISPESRALPSQLPPTSRDHSPGSDPSQLMDTAGRKHAHVKASPLGNTRAPAMGLCFVFALGSCGLLCHKFQKSRALPKAEKKRVSQKSLDFQHQPCSLCAGPDANQAL